MSDFRSIAPPAKKIETLHYDAPEKLVLANNVELYTLEPKDNEVIKLHWHWPFGTLQQSRKFQARSALSLSLNGSTQHTAEEIQERFDFWGTTISTDTALLHSDLTLKCTKEFFHESLDWLKTNYLDAIFPEAELHNYQQIEAASLQRKTTTPRYWANRLCMEAIFGPDDPNTRYAELSDIASIDVAALQQFHKDYYQPGNAIWIVGGDIDTGIKKALQDLAADLGPAKTWNTTGSNGRKTPAEAGSFVRELENTTQVSMFLAREIPSISEAEYHKFSLLNLILGGFFGSRLMQEIREERGLTYGIGSYISQTTYGNTWCIAGEMNSANAREAETATKELLQSMIDNPPSGDELERAKRYYAGQFRSSFDGPFAMASKLKGLMVRGYSFGHFDHALETIWSTTTDDLWQLANNYLHPQTFHSVLAGDIKS